MYLVYGRNTARGIAAHAQLQNELSDREQAAQRRKERERQHQLWIDAIERAKPERVKEATRLEAENQRSRDKLNSLPEWMREVVVEVAGKHKVSHLMMMADCRKKVIVVARNEALYRIKERGGDKVSFANIGRRFNRDHTAVLHAVACHSLLTGEPRLSNFDVEAHLVKKAHRARTQYLWDKAA